MTDWKDWHAEYEDPESRLSQRLAVVQGFIRAALDAAPPGPIRVVSACAGEGRDLLGVLRDHPRRDDVVGRLVELDPALAARAEAGAPHGIEVVVGDAGLFESYAGAVPADLVLFCGVFGNVTDADVEHTVGTLPSFCAPGATVVWTRHTNEPDLTPAIRRWFAGAGFAEVGFVASPNRFGVGAHRYTGKRLFTFER
jgi:hypothetical protein